jgi:hypothetical protein
MTVSLVGVESVVKRNLRLRQAVTAGWSPTRRKVEPAGVGPVASGAISGVIGSDLGNRLVRSGKATVSQECIVFADKQCDAVIRQAAWCWPRPLLKAIRLPIRRAMRPAFHPGDVPFAIEVNRQLSNNSNSDDRQSSQSGLSFEPFQSRLQGCHSAFTSSPRLVRFFNRCSRHLLTTSRVPQPAPIQSRGPRCLRFRSP